jgi:hypothetical protein
MSVFTKIEDFFHTTEQDVIEVIAAIPHGIVVAEEALQKASHWIVGQAPNISANLQLAEGLIVASGGGADPQVRAAIAAANVAVAGLNAYAKASATGNITTDAIAQGYIAVKQASAAAASASSAAAANAAAKATTAVSAPAPVAQ